MDQAILNLMDRVRNAPDEAAREELREETNPVLGAHFARYPHELEEFAFDLLNAAWADAMGQDIVPQIIEVKTVGLGEPDYIDEDLRGQRAYWQGKGGQILSDIMRYERSQMPREEMVTAFDYHQDEIATNFWGQFDKITGQAREKLRQLPVERLIELVQAAINSGTNFGVFAGQTLSSVQIDSIVTEVARASRGGVTIFGTDVALTHLAGVGLEFGDSVAEQVFRTGRIGQYKGHRVVQVENFENFLGNFVLPDDELWVVGRDAGRLTYYGPQAKVQQLRLPSFYGRWETARDAGMLLYGADRGRVGRIVLV
jgi:hypothetical protein